MLRKRLDLPFQCPLSRGGVRGGRCPGRVSDGVLSGDGAHAATQILATGGAGAIDAADRRRGVAAQGQSGDHHRRLLPSLPGIEKLRSKKWHGREILHRENGKPLLRKMNDGRMLNWNVQSDDPLCTLQEAFEKVNPNLMPILHTRRKSWVASSRPSVRFTS